MAASAAAFASDLRTMGEDDQRTERLVTVVEALWEILKGQGHGDAELEAAIEAVVARREAARSALTGRLCPECDARISKGMSRCQICGFEVEAEPDPLGGL